MRDFVRLTRRFLEYTVGRNRRIVLICALLVVGGYVAKAGLALALKLLTDALEAGDREAAMWTLAALVPIMIASRIEEDSLIDYVATHQYNNAAHGFENHLLSLDLDLPRVDHLEDPSYLDRYSLLQGDTEDLVKVIWTWIRIFAASIQTAVASVLLARVHPLLVLFPFAVAPVLAADARGARIRDRGRLAAAKHDRLDAALHSIVISPLSAKEAKVAGAEAELARRASEEWDSSTAAVVRSIVHAQLLASLAWLVFGAAQVGAVAWIGMRVGAGQATLGDVVLVITLGLQSRSQLGTFVWNASRGRRTGLAFRRYRELLSIHDDRAKPLVDPVAAPEALRRGISVENVSFRYPNAEHLSLDGLSLELPAGKTVAIVGENGAGKSTLVKLLCGLYAPTTGRIFVDDLDLAHIEPGEWRRRVASLFQDFARLQFSAADAIGVGDLPHREDQRALDAAVHRAGAGTTIDALPARYETQLGQMFGGVELSGGQWQRLALAQSMMRTTPILLILDEPASALDPFAEHDLFDRYATAAQTAAGERGAVTVFVSHRFSTVRMADLIVVMDGGDVVDLGTHEELLSRGGIYAELYNLQASAYADE